MAIRLFWPFVGPDQFHPNEKFQHSFEEALTTSVMHHLIPRKQFQADQIQKKCIFCHANGISGAFWIILWPQMTPTLQMNDRKWPQMTTQGPESFHAPRANWIILSQLGYFMTSLELTFRWKIWPQYDRKIQQESTSNDPLWPHMIWITWYHFVKWSKTK